MGSGGCRSLGGESNCQCSYSDLFVVTLEVSFRNGVLVALVACDPPQYDHIVAITFKRCCHDYSHRHGGCHFGSKTLTFWW